MAGILEHYERMTAYVHSPGTTMYLPLDKLIKLLQPVLTTWRGAAIRQHGEDDPYHLRLLDVPAPRNGSIAYTFEHTIGALTVTPVPHCCGLCLGSGFRSKPNDVKYLDPMFEWFEYLSWYELERSQVTYVSTNKQNEINEVLRARGYENAYEFINANTGHTIYNWFKDVEGDALYDDDDYDDDYYDDDDEETDEE